MAYTVLYTLSRPIRFCTDVPILYMHAYKCIGEKAARPVKCCTGHFRVFRSWRLLAYRCFYRFDLIHIYWTLDIKRLIYEYIYIYIHRQIWTEGAKLFKITSHYQRAALYSVNIDPPRSDGAYRGSIYNSWRYLANSETRVQHEGMGVIKKIQ